MAKRPLTSATGYLCACATLAIIGCNARPMGTVDGETVVQSDQRYTQAVNREVDLLFVVDGSPSMKAEQADLAAKFRQLIDALKLRTAGEAAPDVRIGVTTTDVQRRGAQCETFDPRAGGELIDASSSGCGVRATKPWISYRQGRSNLVGGSGSDEIDKVRQAFSCLARVGTEGCGFEQPLEAARRALDGKTNPGFVRPNALLAVVFITDEDDCSARDLALIDPDNSSYGNPNTRCFQRGFSCDVERRAGVEIHTNCKPRTDYLYGVERYVEALKGLKAGRPDRVIVSVIAGKAADEVKVQTGGSSGGIAPSCGDAAPALRLDALVEAFGDNGLFHPICSADVGPALSALGDKISARLGPQCVTRPVLTREGRLACREGDIIGRDAQGRPVRCAQNTLADAECVVERVAGRRADAPRSQIPQCRAGARTAGACWRLAPAAKCAARASSTPYRLEIVGDSQPAPGTYALMRCRAAAQPWGSSALAAAHAASSGSARD